MFRLGKQYCQIQRLGYCLSIHFSCIKTLPILKKMFSIEVYRLAIGALAIVHHIRLWNIPCEYVKGQAFQYPVLLKRFTCFILSLPKWTFTGLPNLLKMVLKVTRAWNNQKLCNSNTSASNTSPRKRKNRQYAGYAGKQCTSNAYFALTFFVTNNNYIWKAFRVDNILEQGYELLLYVYIDYIHVSVSKLAH